jgi:hypothetical protein
MFSSFNAVRPPTFFLTFTMNPYWAEYQALKRDRGTFSDSAMTAIVVKAKLSALMKFIKDHEILGKASGLYRESNIRNDVFHIPISFFGLILTHKTFTQSRR